MKLRTSDFSFGRMVNEQKINYDEVSLAESCDPATDLAIVEMLRYSLEHADINLPGKVFADKFWPILKDLSAAKVHYSWGFYIHMYF